MFVCLLVVFIWRVMSPLPLLQVRPNLGAYDLWVGRDLCRTKTAVSHPKDHQYALILMCPDFFLICRRECTNLDEIFYWEKVGAKDTKSEEIPPRSIPCLNVNNYIWSISKSKRAEGTRFLTIVHTYFLKQT